MRLSPGVTVVSIDKTLNLDVPDLFLDDAILLGAKGSSRCKKPYKLLPWSCAGLAPGGHGERVRCSAKRTRKVDS